VAVTVCVGVAAFAAARRAGPAWRGAIEVGVGLVAVSAGVGIGAPHLAKAGWSLATVAGLVTLAAGAVLLVLGAVRLVRAARSWWRVPVAVAVLAMTVAWVGSVSQAVAATNVPTTALDGRRPSDLGLEALDVELRTPDGVTLSGWYLPSHNHAAVALLHGAGSTRSAVLDHAAVLARHGYGVLLFDARGHGRSGGRAMDFGWFGDRDVAAALDYLQQRADVDPGRVAVVGLSMGGEEAIGAAAHDARIRAVVAEGATNRVAADKAWLSEAFGVRGWVQERLEWLTYTAADVLTAAAPPISLRRAVAESGRPILLIAAGKVTDEGRAARYVQAGSPATVQVWEVDSGGHTGGLTTQPAQWEQRVVGFLDGVLTAGA
jgi:pimeloyl-ACP methyl ester carboxylesterase